MAITATIGAADLAICDELTIRSAVAAERSRIHHAFLSVKRVCQHCAAGTRIGALASASADEDADRTATGWAAEPGDAGP
jgi:hypothetical protein